MHSEDQIESYLVRRVEELGGMCEKFTSPGRNAVPDRLISLPPHKIFGSRVVFVETKHEGGRQGFPHNAHERAQARDHARRRAMGFEVWVIDSYQGVEKFIQVFF